MGAVRRLAFLVALLCWPAASAAQPLPALAGPVNDFANVIDEASSARIDQVSRALERASGDVVVVATVTSVEPFADIREMAVKLFENGGKGIGQQGKDNGLLVLVAIRERKIWIEVGYGLEEFVTDGFAGETTREVMAPLFRQGNYGGGILAGVARLAGRIAERRGVTLEALPQVEPARSPTGHRSSSAPVVIGILILVILMSLNDRSGRGGRRVGRWGGSTWSGWSSGVGPFGGGGFGGGFGGFGGGGGGGFGGFGGGRSGGGGGGGSW